MSTSTSRETQNPKYGPDTDPASNSRLSALKSTPHTLEQSRTKPRFQASVCDQDISPLCSLDDTLPDLMPNRQPLSALITNQSSSKSSRSNSPPSTLNTKRGYTSFERPTSAKLPENRGSFIQQAKAPSSSKHSLLKESKVDMSFANASHIPASHSRLPEKKEPVSLGGYIMNNINNMMKVSPPKKSLSAVVTKQGKKKPKPFKQSPLKKYMVDRSVSSSPDKKKPSPSKRSPLNESKADIRLPTSEKSQAGTTSHSHFKHPYPWIGPHQGGAGSSLASTKSKTPEQSLPKKHKVGNKETSSSTHGNISSSAETLAQDSGSLDTVKPLDTSSQLSYGAFFRAPDKLHPDDYLVLRESFSIAPFPSSAEKYRLAAKLDITVARVERYFTTKRHTTRRKLARLGLSGNDQAFIMACQGKDLTSLFPEETQLEELLAPVNYPLSGMEAGGGKWKDVLMDQGLEFVVEYIFSNHP